MVRLFLSDPRCLELGLTVIRVAVGVIFMIHGWGKLSGGVASWQWLGSQMALLGITCWPVLWGFLAALSEFGGGLCLVLGLGTRIAAIALGFVMIIATLFHISKGDDFNSVWSHPFTLLFVFIGLIIAGSGRYSLDRHLFGDKQNSEMRR